MSINLKFHEVNFNNHTRFLRVFLPASYNPDKRYPVLYMHDGQNLFDATISYSKESWEAGQTVDKLGLDLIIVGIDNSCARLDEYSPWKYNAGFDIPFANDTGGLGDSYAKWVTEEVKPFIDKTYPTIPTKEATFIAGSSMGAYISIYMAVKYPEVFSNVGVFSLASWFNEKDFLAYINEKGLAKHQRFFIFVGGLETSDATIPEFPEVYLNSIKHFMDELDKAGITDYEYHMIPDAKHNENAWKRIFPKFASWLSLK